jgi:hypothetical protein
MTLGRRVWALSALLLILAFPGCNDENNPASPNGLTVACAAAPSSGAAPLAVAFGFRTDGAQGSSQVSIDYGDGSSGGDPNAGHVYRSAGSFTATFTVKTSTQTATCSTGVTVITETPSTLPAGGNQPPNAVFKTSPDAGGGGRISGTAPFEVRFNMCPTVDPDHDPLLFTTDFEGDGALDVVGSSGAACRSSHVYGRGDYRPRVCVTDLAGPGGQPLHSAQCQVYDVRAN